MVQDVSTFGVTTADDGSADLVTRTGFRFHVRPVLTSDEAALAEFFTHVTRNDLRFRFLTAVHKVGHETFVRLAQVDHERTEDFLAFGEDGTTVIATAMLAADAALERAEVAISIRADYKKRGVSWTLLEHVARFARAKGIQTLESIESHDNGKRSSWSGRWALSSHPIRVIPRCHWFEKHSRPIERPRACDEGA